MLVRRVQKAPQKERKSKNQKQKTKNYLFISATTACVQQQPGGIGLPCGQVLGCPRKVQILSVASKDKMCSNLQACSSISLSLSMCRVSVNKRSASRCRRMTLAARCSPRGVNSIMRLPCSGTACPG